MRFRRPDGRTAKVTLGDVDLSGRELEGEPVIGQSLTLAAARALATNLTRHRARGIDVVATRQAEVARTRDAAVKRSANTFGAALPQFFADYKTRKHRLARSAPLA